MTSTLRTSEKVDLISTALHAFHEGITPPTKNKEVNNGKFTYEYADLTSLLEHCKPAMQACGLIFTSGGFTSRILHAGSGQWIETDVPIETTGMNPQQIGSALSYARRYCFLGLLG